MNMDLSALIKSLFGAICNNRIRLICFVINENFIILSGNCILLNNKNKF